MDILLFTGYSGSGKTTLAKKLNNDYDIPILGEREILHGLAISNGFERSREWLAHDGLDRVLALVRIEIAIQITGLNWAPELIIDGSYDRKLPDLLEQISRRLFIISFELDNRVREFRLKVRYGDEELARKEMEFIDEFKREAGVEEIMARADIKIKADTSIEHTESYLLKRLREKGFNPYANVERR